MCSDCDEDDDWLKKQRKKQAREKHDWLSYLWFHGTQKQFQKWLDDICLLKRSDGFFLGDHAKIAEGCDEYAEPGERALEKLEQLMAKSKENSGPQAMPFQMGLGTAIKVLKDELKSRNGF